MKLLIEPTLMERAAFEGARRDPALRCEFERRRTACYEAPSEVRERAFAEFYESWFRRLGFHTTLESITADFPFVRAHVDRMVVSTASGRNEGVELFGDGGRRVLTMRILPATLQSPVDFTRWAAHELTHAEDMLDPAFAYDRNIRPCGANPAEANLVRERYAVLWALSVDARLNARMALPPGWITRRRGELERAFGVGGESAAFDEVWREFQATRPTHGALIARAESRYPLARAADSAADGAPSVRPGDACPICAFSTFEWADLTNEAALISAVQASFDSWHPTSGLCMRCAEVYRSVAAMPSQVCLLKGV